MSSATYHCPHCNQLCKHRAHFSGAKVQCAACGGFYFEPSDPVPGSRPKKAERPKRAQSSATELATAVTSTKTLAQPGTQIGADDAKQSLSTVTNNVASNVASNVVTAQTGDLPLASTVLRPANPAELKAPDSSQLRSSRVLRPFEAAGLKATVISWEPGENTGAKIGTTKNCSKDEANEIILRVALKLIKRRWPELYPLLSVRMDEAFDDH